MKKRLVLGSIFLHCILFWLCLTAAQAAPGVVASVQTSVNGIEKSAITLLARLKPRRSPFDIGDITGDFGSADNIPVVISDWRNG